MENDNIRVHLHCPYKVITLCGSTRFKDQFIEAQKRLTLEGNIVISVGLFGHSGDDEVWSEGTKEMLDDMHKRKIEMADEIFVINVGGYIGSSTRSEIEFATRTGKTVRYLEEPGGNRQTMLSRYVGLFTSLNTAKRMGKTAPHKAVMLVSIIDMIQVGLINENEFYFTEVLQRSFTLNWKCYVGDSLLFKPVAATPFWHLGGEPFWSLRREDGGTIDDIKTTPSAGQLKSMGIVASLDKELFTLLQDEQARNQLRGLLVDTYLSTPKPHIPKVLPLFIGMLVPTIY